MPGACGVLGYGDGYRLRVLGHPIPANHDLLTMSGHVSLPVWCERAGLLGRDLRLAGGRNVGL